MIINDNSKNIKIEFLKIIQKNIRRFEKNCFAIKALSFTFLSAFIAAIFALDTNWYFLFVEIIFLALMCLDGKYLSFSRKFCNIYKKVVESKAECDFTIDVKTNFKELLKAIFSWSVIWVYFIPIIFIPIIIFLVEYN